MKQRTITALAIIAAVIPIFFSEPYMYLILILVGIIAALELNDLVSDTKFPLIIGLNFALIISLGLDFIASYDKIIVLGIFLLIYVLFGLIYFDLGFHNLSLMYTVSIIVGFALNAFVNIYLLDKWFILYVLLVTYGSDTGAYLVGSVFGKHKLIPQISPNKTVEGAIGGILVGGILGSVFLFFFGGNENIGLAILTSFFMPIIGQLGDLFFSSLKRLYNRKDFGTLMPGHGGVLDRIDSLLFCLVFVTIFIRMGSLGVLL